MDILFSVKSKADGTTRDVQCDLIGGLTIGRGPETGLPLDGPGISREHLLLEADGGELFVTDLSSNGSWVNGNRIPRSKKLRIGATDSIELPGYEIRYELLPDAPVAAVPAEEVKAVVTAPAEATSVMVQPPAAAPVQPPAPQVALQPVPAPVQLEPPAKRSMLAPVTDFLHSFTFFERLLVLLALASFTLLFLYSKS